MINSLKRLLVIRAVCCKSCRLEVGAARAVVMTMSCLYKSEGAKHVSIAAEYQKRKRKAARYNARYMQ